MLAHAVSWGFIEKSPADGLRLIPEARETVKWREPKGFTPTSVASFGRISRRRIPGHRGWYRWLPIVCAYQGCRQEEACQLMKSDIWQHDSGVWVMRITDAGQDQKVKNDPSIRTIPLHTKLIERGFLQHVAPESWSAGLRFVEA